MAAGQFLHADGGPVAGRDLFGVPNIWRTVRVDDSTLLGGLGAHCFLDRRVHQLAWTGTFAQRELREETNILRRVWQQVLDFSMDSSPRFLLPPLPLPSPFSLHPSF